MQARCLTRRVTRIVGRVAYNTNKEAVDFLRTQGKDLYPQYGDIWEKERNSEVVMVTQYDYPDRTFEQRAIRPSPIFQKWHGQTICLY
ncbi:MAG: hypothetical protein AB2L24_03245 [Mangrovibacterium sp.]